MYSKRNVMICIAVLLAVVMGLVVYTSVKPKSPETEVSSTENTAAVDSAKICAVSYDIDLKLDPKKERVEQTVFMDIANKSGDEEFSSLYIRYYPNGYIDALVKENPEIKEENEGSKTTVDAEDIRDLALYASDFMGVDTFEVEGVKIENCYLKTTGEDVYRTLSKQFITDAFTKLTDPP